MCNLGVLCARARACSLDSYVRACVCPQYFTVIILFPYLICRLRVDRLRLQS